MDTDHYYSSTEDEDCDGVLKRALEVEFSDDFNPNSVPRDGHEFLQHVMYERKRYKTLSVSNINPEEYKKNQTLCIELGKPVIKSSECIPSKEWQNKKVTHFKEFWHYLHKIMGDRQSVTTFDEETFIHTAETEQPVLSEVAVLAQSAKIKMLELLTKYISKIKTSEDFKDNVGMWIFAVLAALDIPLSPSDCFVLREFCKRCLVTRSNLADSGDTTCTNALNFFVCIVGRFYNQLDLAD